MSEQRLSFAAAAAAAKKLSALMLLFVLLLLLLIPPVLGVTATAVRLERSTNKAVFFRKKVKDPVVQRAEDLAKLQEFIHVEFSCAGMPSDYIVRARDVIEMMCPNYRLVWKVGRLFVRRCLLWFSLLRGVMRHAADCAAAEAVHLTLCICFVFFLCVLLFVHTYVRTHARTCSFYVFHACMRRPLPPALAERCRAWFASRGITRNFALEIQSARPSAWCLWRKTATSKWRRRRLF